MATLKPRQAAKLLNVTVTTLQKWDREGVLPAFRLKTDRRYYTTEQIEEFMGKSAPPKQAGKTIIYARVSSTAQAADLASQIAVLQAHSEAQGYAVDEVIKDIGSGLNYERKKWNSLLDMIAQGEVERVLLTHGDRFVRVGFSWLAQWLNRYGCTVEVVKHGCAGASVGAGTVGRDELVQDLIGMVRAVLVRVRCKGNGSCHDAEVLEHVLAMLGRLLGAGCTGDCRGVASQEPAQVQVGLFDELFKEELVNEFHEEDM